MSYDPSYGHIAKPTTLTIETEDADLIVTLVRNSNQKYHRIAEREFVFTDSQWSVEPRSIHGKFRLMEIKHVDLDHWPPTEQPEGLRPYMQVNKWLPIEHRPLITGYYIVGHRGYQERLLFMGPEKHWAPGQVNIGWNRMGRRGWERDDPVERFRATRCMLIQFPEGDPE